MKNTKIKIASVTLVLTLTFAATFVFLPIVSAHDPPWTFPTTAYVALSPNTVGVGQYTLIVYWLDKYPPTAGGEGGDRWRGHIIEVTKPDGSTEQLGPFTSGPVGSGWTVYTPDQIGTYTIVHSWPGQTVTNGTGVPNLGGIAYVGDYFGPSTSEPTTLNVQQDPIEGWKEPPVTTDYWTRPIPTANREWTQLTSNWIGGSWLRYSNFQEQGKAPNTAHILYANPIIHGGLADERYGAVKYDTADYENFFPTPIVMSGKIYYNAGTYPNYGYSKVDLQTGELEWYKNGTDNGLGNIVVDQRYQGLGGAGVYSGQTFPQLSFGQLFNYYGLNGAGVLNHLWITQSMGSISILPEDLDTLPPEIRVRLSQVDIDRLKVGVGVQLPAETWWHMLDANTGNWVMSLRNVPSGTSVTDQDGSIVLYNYNSATGQFLVWNVTQSIGPPSPSGTGQQQWEPRQGHVLDAVNDTSWTEWGPVISYLGLITEDQIRPRSGYTMNVTGPAGLPGLIGVLQDEQGVPKTMFFADMGTVGFFGGSLSDTFRVAVVRIDENVAPYSPYPDQSWTQNTNLGYGVTLLWDKNIPVPLSGNKTFLLGPRSYEDKVFTVWCKETRQWFGYSLDDGTLLWGPTEPQPSWDMYGGFITTASGGMYAYGTLYSGYFGGILHAYNMKTGQLKWTYTAEGIGYESPYGNFPIFYGGGYAAADGKVFLYSTEHSPTQPLWRGSYLRAIDAYSGEELWKSLNFVSSLAIADGYIVTGNHYDNRMYVYGKGPSATKVKGPEFSIPFGEEVLITGTVTDQSPGAKDTPAIGDEYMNDWMDYLYMKQVCPENIEGVEMVLETIDPNGNTYEIGRTTSSAYGTFGLTFTPQVPGLYQIIANFKGSDSYGSSSASTYIYVSPGATSAHPIELEPNTPTPTTPEPTEPEPTEIITETPLITPEVAIIALVAVACVIGLVSFWALRKRK